MGVGGYFQFNCKPINYCKNHSINKIPIMSSIANILFLMSDVLITHPPIHKRIKIVSQLSNNKVIRYIPEFTQKFSKNICDYLSDN